MVLEAAVETLVTVGSVFALVEWRFRVFRVCLRDLNARMDNHLENNSKDQK